MTIPSLADECPVFARLLAAVTGHGPLDEDVLAEVGAHVPTCARCQAGLAGMAHDAGLSPEGLRALWAHADPTAQPGEDVPDDERMAAYAHVVLTAGEEAARKRWPGTAAHVRACPLCTAELAEDLAFLRFARQHQSASFQMTPPIGAAPAAPPPPPGVPASPSMPVVVPLRPFRLPEQPILRRGNTLTIPQLGRTRGIPPAMQPGGTHYAQLRGAAGEAGEAGADVFVCDLRDETQPGPWARLECLCVPRYTGGMKCVMQTLEVRSADDAGTLVGGLPWRLEREQPGGAREFIFEGVCDTDGRDAWHVTTGGRYLLTVTYHGRPLELPLVLHEEALPGALRGDAMTAPTPIAQMIVWVHNPGAKTRHYEFVIPAQREQPVLIFKTKAISDRDRKQLERDMLEAATTLTRLARNDVEARKLGELHFSTLGAHASDLIPDEVRAFLFRETTPLMIQTNDPVFPWELLHHDDGTFLGMHRPVSRVICNYAPPPPAEWGDKRRALFIADPQNDLQRARDEISAILDCFARYPHPYDPDPIIGAEATLERLQQAFDRNNEILHFAGHVDFGLTFQDANALPCADGMQIDAAALRRVRGRFGLVFINGCQGARTVLEPKRDQISTTPRLDGLAQAFLTRGARIFISSLWPIVDDSASRFAQAFYQQVIENRLSFGEALRRVRVAWREQYPDDPTWAGYVMYGEPHLTLETLRAAHAVPIVATQDLARVIIPTPAVTPDYRQVREGPSAADDATADDATAGDIAAEDDQDSIAVLRPPAEPPIADAVQVFFIRHVGVLEVVLDGDAHAALARAFAWLDLRKRRALFRGDLLLALAEEPPLAAALAAQGITRDHLAEINAVIMRRHEDEPIEYWPSEGVKRVFAAAAQRAITAGRIAVSAQDLAEALLTPPLDGTAALMLLLAPCDGTALRVALHGAAAPPSPAPVAAPPAFFVPDGDLLPGDDRDTATELTDLLEDAKRNGGKDAPPFVAREQEILAVLRSLTNRSAPHTLVRGPMGVGKTAMIRAIAQRMALQPDDAEVASLRGWYVFQVRRAADGAPIGTWLANRLAKLYTNNQPAIIVLDDLAALATDATLVETLVRYATDQRLRYLATATEAEALALRQAAPELMRVFAVVPLAPPAAVAARRIVRDYAAYFGRKEGVHFEQGALQVALEAGPLPTLALPGAAVVRLTEAFARVISRARPSAPPHPTTTQPEITPIITPADVRAVITRAGGRP